MKKKSIIKFMSLMGVISLAASASAQERIQTTFVSGSTTVPKEGAAMVTDGLRYTKWCIDSKDLMPYNVVLDAQKEVKLKEYGLVTGDDTHNYPERNPLRWKVMGSNDKKDWKTIHEVKFDRLMRDENEQEYRYKVEAEASYRYYKFVFTEFAAGTRLQLSEINLY